LKKYFREHPEQLVFFDWHDMNSTLLFVHT
jgi:hypothetical protein